MIRADSLKSFVLSFRGFNLLGLGALLLWVYWPTLEELFRRWSTDHQYSHGYLVPGFALVLLWLRRGKLPAANTGACAWGIALLLLGGGLRLAGSYIYLDWLEAFSLLPCVAGVAVFLGGARMLAWSWPAIAFLVFMIPLPFRVETAMSGPLRAIATGASTYSLQTIGISAFSEGNVIVLDDARLGVAEACSGLSMLTIFFALSVAVAVLLQRPLWERLLIVLSAVPIAMAANVIRITVTGVLYETAGHELAELVFHDLAGWFMMPVGLGLLFLELKVLSHVLIPLPERATAAVLQPSVQQRPRLAVPPPTRKSMPPVQTGTGS
jgi:exosortase